MSTFFRNCLMLTMVLGMAVGQASAEVKTPASPAGSVDPAAGCPEGLTPPAAGLQVPARATIAVLGDSLADGIWGGLFRKLVRDKRYTVYRGAKNSVGFGGGDLLDMMDKAFAAGPVDAIVMMVGANDRGGIYVDGKLEAPYKSPQWPDVYRRRVDNFMDASYSRGIPMVWILLPVMREGDAEADARKINSIIMAAAADRRRVRLVESRPMTVDPEGQYAAYLKDAKGQPRLVRHTDGVHFSDFGYDIIADAAFARLNEMSVRFWLMSTRK
ncbi:MAG: DUF459 domain-containing protein [Alphaproteobacteria bacterium]|nr:DUF459 domain-containing protein [Alphaproteobacteria bacterium]